MIDHFDSSCFVWGKTGFLYCELLGFTRKTQVKKTVFR